MPSSQDIANDSAATFAAYPELVTKIDAGATVPDADLDQWIGASYANFVDGCLEQINEVFVGSRSIAGPLRLADAPGSGWAAGCETIQIGDGTANRGVSGFTPTTGEFCLVQRTSRDDRENYVALDASARRVVLLAGRDLNTAGALQLKHYTTYGALGPVFSFQATDVGTIGERWRDLALKRHAYIDPDTAPATPSSGAVLYVDSADGALKVKFSTGTTTTLASP
jgi:hypothetical protein